MKLFGIMAVLLISLPFIAIGFLFASARQGLRWGRDLVGMSLER